MSSGRPPRVGEAADIEALQPLATCPGDGLEPLLILRTRARAPASPRQQEPIITHGVGPASRRDLRTPYGARARCNSVTATRRQSKESPESDQGKPDEPAPFLQAVNLIGLTIRLILRTPALVAGV